MAFLDKLGELARNVGDKTNEMLEVSRLSSKVRSEENAVADRKRELGQYIFEQYLSGGQLDETAVDYCREIQAGEESIEALNAEIQRLKAAPAQEEPAVCKNCGESLHSDAKYCPTCGAKVEGQPVKMFCPACGREVTEDTRFCSACGTKIKED